MPISNLQASKVAEDINVPSTHYHIIKITIFRFLVAKRVSMAVLIKISSKSSNYQIHPEYHTLL